MNKYNIVAHETDNGSASNGMPWWTGDNISGYAEAFSEVWDSIKGNSQPDAVIIQQTIPENKPENKPNTGLITGLVLGFIFLLLFVLLLRRRKK